MAYTFVRKLGKQGERGPVIVMCFSVFDYSQVIFAAILGLVFLGQIPDWMSIVGYVIIIGSAVFKWNYNLRHE